MPMILQASRIEIPLFATISLVPRGDEMAGLFFSEHLLQDVAIQMFFGRGD